MRRPAPPCAPEISRVACALCAALAAGCGDGDGAPPVTPGILDLPPGWTFIEPGGDTTCARGTPFSYFVRPGTVNRLVIEFRGGGACWSSLTCGLGASIFQETVEPEKHGRVFSYVGIVMALATPIGMAVFGPLADVIRVESLLIVGGLIMIGVMTLAVFMPSGRRAIEAARTPHAEVEPAEAAAG